MYMYKYKRKKKKATKSKQGPKKVSNSVREWLSVGWGDEDTSCIPLMALASLLAIWRSWILLAWILSLYNSIWGTSWLGQCSSQVWCGGSFPGSVCNHSRPTLHVLHWRHTVLFFHWLHKFTCIARLESVEKTEWESESERGGVKEIRSFSLIFECVLPQIHNRTKWTQGPCSLTILYVYPSGKKGGMLPMEELNYFVVYWA